MLEKNKSYSFMVGNRDVIGKLIEEDDESLTLEYAMTIISIGQGTIAPMPLDRFGEQKEFTINKFAVDGVWELAGKALGVFENYAKERQMAESGLVYSASMSDIDRVKR